ncbi:hypothetical protein M501DRAFT_1009951 [Patellaria atrata CBS 101060]|uniref:Putative lipoate-protein ligase A n=1 Tax=Patellaria atrata CBS 101060 TaxID=1346257 RepID=A0A9P4VR97_9PEZI|nr:hypothetical protein M501DRAFT_1009951 [Patellaria atrata CBS 101060]
MSIREISVVRGPGTSSLATNLLVQSYISRSLDPYLNLSIEHYLLQKSPPESRVLFLYTNRPSVIIGRNQNPWLEVNLIAIKAGISAMRDETKAPTVTNIDLVRRRSGGGTVFHDEGNVNWSVICPPSDFTRDKHAEMVVRALRSLSIERARVNERHDIVLDQGREKVEMDNNNTHKTPYTATNESDPRPLKISGSAYKLTRTRALHHATCLLSSPNLSVIPQYLRSPAKPYIQAKGVESVSSPVTNVDITNEDFQHRVQEHFEELYYRSPKRLAAYEVGEEQLDIPEIRKSYEELKSLDWTFSQTPRFKFSTSGQDISPQHAVPGLGFDITMNVRNGVILDIALHSRDGAVESAELNLQGKKLHEIRSWSDALQGLGKHDEILNEFLERTLPCAL